MANLAKKFEEAAKGEKIIGCVVGKFDGGGYRKDALPLSVLNWLEARNKLDYEYDSGYGGADCHAVYAWTKNYVLFVSIYDGATEVEALPRDPTPCFPDYIGGY